MRQQIVAWTDGHYHWHDGCVNASESDSELRAIFDNDGVPDEAKCDTCGGLIAEPREMVNDPRQ
jgi:hypothetical protein